MAMFDCAHCGDRHHVNDFCATGPMSAEPVPPTTRETADHAELARKFEALAVDASAARNLDGAESMMVSIQTIYDLITSRNVLLSEIAALRGALEEAEKDASSWSRCAGEVVTIGESWKERFVLAERQRDEAVGLLRDFIEPYAALDDVQLFRTVTNGHATRITSARAFLANQGADK